MFGLMRRYVFATVVVGLLSAMALVVGVRAVIAGGPNAEAAGAGPAKGGPGRAPEATAVEAVRVESRPFYDALRALGTAQARESIVISPKVTDVIRSIRFESGQRVRQGQVLLELTSVEQEADLAEAVAANAAAQEELRRFLALARGGGRSCRRGGASAGIGGPVARVGPSDPGAVFRHDGVADREPRPAGAARRRHRHARRPLRDQA